MYNQSSKINTLLNRDALIPITLSTANIQIDYVTFNLKGPTDCFDLGQKSGAPSTLMYTCSKAPYEIGIGLSDWAVYNLNIDAILYQNGNPISKMIGKSSDLLKGTYTFGNNKTTLSPNDTITVKMSTSTYLQNNGLGKIAFIYKG